MPHATELIDDAPALSSRKSKSKPSSRGSRSTFALLEAYQILYEHSELATRVDKQLQNLSRNSTQKITKIVSLGLGSLDVQKDQARRLKQLALLLAVRRSLQHIAGGEVQVYAQDPTFNRTDEALLRRVGIMVVHTQAGNDLGEAGFLIDTTTIVYSPFLTLEAYERLLMDARLPLHYVFGDDFNAFLVKWPKHSVERKQVESVIKSGLSKYRRKPIGGEGYWEEQDNSFPLAMYQRLEISGFRKEKAKI